MGMRVIWTAFGGAVAYILAAVAIPTIVVILRNQGVAVSDTQTATVTTIGAIWLAGVGAYLGWRHAQKLEARRDEP